MSKNGLVSGSNSLNVTSKPLSRSCFSMTGAHRLQPAGVGQIHRQPRAVLGPEPARVLGVAGRLHFARHHARDPDCRACTCSMMLCHLRLVGGEAAVGGERHDQRHRGALVGQIDQLLAVDRVLDGPAHVNVGHRTPAGVQAEGVDAGVGRAPRRALGVFQLTMFGFRACAASKTPGCMVGPTSNSLLIMRAAAVSSAARLDEDHAQRLRQRLEARLGAPPVVVAIEDLRLARRVDQDVRAGPDRRARGQIEVVERRRVLALPDVLGQDRDVDLGVLDEVDSRRSGRSACSGRW